MSQKIKVNLLKYGLTVAAVIAVVCTIIFSNDIFNLELVEQLRILSDAFTLPGYLLIFAGVLLHLSNKGAMDGVSYVFTRMIQLLIPTAALKRESYPDFVERRREKNVTGFGFLFIIGAVCLLVSFVILYFYFAVS